MALLGAVEALRKRRNVAMCVVRDLVGGGSFEKGVE